MDKKRQVYLDLIAKNLSVCSSKTVEEVVGSFCEEERKYILEKLKELKAIVLIK